MNCIAIDDSSNALELMKIHIEKIPFLNLLGLFQSAVDAIEIINSNEVDLVFIDIKMPGISGIQFVKSLERQPQIIFTTAYSEYALEGFEANAVDYLLKPITFERFLKAVNKAAVFYNLSNQIVKKSNFLKIKEKYVFFKSGTEIHRLPIEEITYLESQGNYVKVHMLNNTTIMSLMTMSEALAKLNDDIFFQCHRSYIVSLHQIDVISSYRVKIGNSTIPIGKKYRIQFQKKIKKYG